MTALPPCALDHDCPAGCEGIDMTPGQFECECCDLRLCQEKQPGMGYICPTCVCHYNAGAGPDWQQEIEQKRAAHDRMRELSGLPPEVEATESTESAPQHEPKVPGPFNCASDDPQLNVGHLIVANLGGGRGLAICGYNMNIADHPSMHEQRYGDCSCDPAMPRCEACVAAKAASDARKARMTT